MKIKNKNSQKNWNQINFIKSTWNNTEIWLKVEKKHNFDNFSECLKLHSSWSK